MLNKIQTNVHFPLDSGKDVLGLRSLPWSQQEFQLSLQTWGFLNGVYGVSGENRLQLCQKLNSLSPTQYPYHLWFDETPESWGGRSYEVAAYVAHARIQCQKDAEWSWSAVALTGMLNSDGDIEAVGGLAEKIQGLLDSGLVLEGFAYPAKQTPSDKERQLLQELKSNGVELYPIHHIRDIPNAWVKPQGDPPDDPNNGITPWLYAIGLLLTLFITYPFLTEVIDTSTEFASTLAPQAAAKPLATPHYHWRQFQGHDAKGEPRWGDTQTLNAATRLQTNDRLYISFTAKQSAHYYWFLLTEEGELWELFRADNQERYLSAGTTIKLPHTGVILDPPSGRLNSYFITSDQADRELQQIIQSLSVAGSSRDPALSDRFQAQLLQLPNERIQSQIFTQY